MPLECNYTFIYTYMQQRDNRNEGKRQWIFDKSK